MAYKRKATRRKWTKKRVTKKARKGSSFAAKVKKVILRTAEPKMKPYGHNVIAPREINHDSYAAGYLLDGGLQMPLQGMGDTERIGDEIYTSNIKVQMLLGQKQDRMNVTFRIIVVKCTDTAVPTSYNTLFIGTTANCLLDEVNKDRVSVVYDKLIKKTISSQLDVAGGAKEFTFVHKFNVPLKQKVKFATDATSTSDNRKKHFMYVFAYDAFGTLPTDNIAYCQTYSTVYYKDP